MELAVVGALAGLALIDSTSFGTLGIPVVMLMQKVVRSRALLLYLATITAFYFALGVALLAGADSLLAAMQHFSQSGTALWIQLGVGVALFGVSFLVDKRGRAWIARMRGPRAEPPRESRLQRLKGALTGPNPRTGAVISVALAAGVVEAASMIPYLGAIGVLSRQELTWTAKVAVLAGYVLLMAIPAVLLLGLRLATAHRAEPVLARIRSWLERNEADMLSWILGIVGLILAINAWGALQEHGLINL